MRSAVPLPCFFDVVKSQGVAGQRPRQGTKSCRMGRNSARLYIKVDWSQSWTFSQSFSYALDFQINVMKRKITITFVEKSSNEVE